MTSSFARIKHALIGLFAASVLTAQVDPKLVTQTDLLDVYKSGNPAEMITIFDFSGSMENAFWHEHYWTDLNSDTGNSMRIDVTTGAVSISLGGSITATGFLVDPSGTRITTVPITAAVVKRASHARLTAAKTSSGKTYTRTVDIPVPWTILRKPDTLPTLPAPGSAPVPDFAFDPNSSKISPTKVEFDTLYAVSDVNVLRNDSGTYYLGRFAYNPDYIYWLFWGNVIKAANGNGYNVTPVAGYMDDRNQAPPGTIFTTSTTGIKPAYPAGGGYVIPGVYDPSYGSASAPSTTEWSNKRGTTFNNGIPVGMRSMFLKKAVLETWLHQQGKVLWAYRFLDVTTEPNKDIKSQNFTTGAQRNLTAFKSVTTGIHPSVSDIQKKRPNGATPLTSALANTYAQMGETATGLSVFDKANSGRQPSPCSKSFVILFTDGMANTDDNGSAEVATGGATATLTEANLQSLSYSKLNFGQTNHNIWSLAAVAAHGLDNGTNNASQLTTGTAAPSSFAPFRVRGRGAEGTPGRKITTMTVGLSLAGTNTSSIDTGGKGPLLRTALYGDPSNTDKFNLAQSVAYGKTPTGPDGIATNFFDATDPDALIRSLSSILARITSADTGITAPSAPLVGLNLGNRAYLGRFATLGKDSSGSVWSGDLLMTGLGTRPDGSVGLRDNTGNFQTSINAANAVASAALVLKAKGWKNRNIYTMVPGTSIPSTGLDLTAAAQKFDTSNTLLTPKVMGVGTSTDAQRLIRFIRGASALAQVDGTDTSRGDIMGDVINSSPMALDYDPGLIPASSSLAAAWSAYSGMTDPRFRVVFVGDNQGHFHAFGEVSAIDGSGVLRGQMDELWSFVPPELLNAPSVATTVPKLSALQAVGNDHIYTVDGSPVAYLKDVPLPGIFSGNGRVDGGETARVIFGMRKGGRSYYALDVANPGQPKLSWMLDPNSSSDQTIKTMGLATSDPAIARVETGSPAVVKDMVLLGGGYSDSLMDKKTIGNNVGPVKLGRSLLALDVLDGTPIKIYDFVNNGSLAGSFPNMGPISAGVFPFEFFSGSRKAQRVYFGDYSGGVYALGSMKTRTTSPVGWRVDSSNIDEWTMDGSANISSTPGNAGIRWIYKGPITLTGGDITEASPITSTPVAYRISRPIPQFRRPSTSTNAPNMIPAVVGVTFGTGDRNNPMDLPLAVNPVGKVSHRQVMVFDRQDSADLPTLNGLPSNVNASANAITDAQLSDQTSTATPGDTSYLGNNQFLGYYLRFDTPIKDSVTDADMYEKSYLRALVIKGSLVFSAFSPGKAGTTAACQGAGITRTYRMCDALVPVFADGEKPANPSVVDRTSADCSGSAFIWTNLAGAVTAVGGNMVLQSGEGASAATIPNSLEIKDLKTPPGSTVFAPRTWRIIR